MAQDIRRVERTRPGVGLGGCLLASAIAAGTALLLFLVVGIAIGRIGGWMDLNPFGVFAEPDTRIDDRRQAVVVEMRDLARLETQSYTIEKVISAEKQGNVFQDLLFGDRILLIAHGSVIAGVDLSKLEESDVQVAGDDIRLELPPSEVFVSTLDNEQTRVYDRERGLLSRGDATLETEARQAAQDALVVAACDAGILGQAAEQARHQLMTLLTGFGFTTTTVVAPVGECPVAPEA